MELHYILLENLTVAKINARTHGATDNLDSLAASIRAQGLLQPLLVRSVADSERFEIVAGQRRFLACHRLAQEQPNCSRSQSSADLRAIIGRFLLTLVDSVVL